MSDGPAVLVDLVIVSSLVSLVSEEVDLFEALVLDMAESIGLVPALWENVEGDLAANAVGQVVRGKLLLQEVDKVAANVVLLVVCLELVPLLYAMGRKGFGQSFKRMRMVVYPAAYLAFLPMGETLIMPFRNSMKVPLMTGTVSVLSDTAKAPSYEPLDWDIEVCHVVKDELDHLLVAVLSDMLDEAGRSELFAKLVGSQAVLCEAVVEVIDDWWRTQHQYVAE
jgi:hypothetical protein